jgi:hypothetical protein
MDSPAKLRDGNLRSQEQWLDQWLKVEKIETHKFGIAAADGQANALRRALNEK